MRQCIRPGVSGVVWIGQREEVAQQLVATERSARKLVFETIVELTETGKHLHPAIAKNVVCKTESRRQLGTPTKLDRLPVFTERWYVLILETQTKIKCQARLRLPAILNIETGVCALGQT